MLDQQRRRTDGVRGGHAGSAVGAVGGIAGVERRIEGVAIRDHVGLDPAVVGGAAGGKGTEVGLRRVAGAAGHGISRRTNGDDVFGNGVETDGLEAAAVIAVAGGMERGIIADDGAAAGCQGDGLAGGRGVGVIVAGAAEDQIERGVERQRVAVAGVGVVKAEVALDGGGRGAGAIPFPDAVGRAAVDVVPAADVAVAVVGEVDFPRLACGSGPAGGHFRGVAVPVVGIDRRGTGHPAGGRDDARSAESAADMGGVVNGGGTVDDGHAAAEFLVGGAGGTAVPETDGDAGAGEGIRGSPQQIGTGGDGGVDVGGSEIKRAVAVEVGDFLDAAVRLNRPQRQAEEGGAGTGVLAAGGLDFRHARDHPRAVGRARELGGGVGEEVGKRFLGRQRICQNQSRENRKCRKVKTHPRPDHKCETSGCKALNRGMKGRVISRDTRRRAARRAGEGVGIGGCQPRLFCELTTCL